MKTVEFIKLLKKLPETAEVYFDDLNGGLIPIASVRVGRKEDKVKAGIKPDTVIAIISD